MKRIYHWIIFLMLATPWASADVVAQGFVLITEDTFSPAIGDSDQNHMQVRIEDFEILDHAVTNAEYGIFIKETGYPAPLFWVDGKIPAGKEDLPVIYVNFKDVNEYLRWLTTKDGQMHRLPTTFEFEYAARGGNSGKKYPWGDDHPEGNANYDSGNERSFDQWDEYLKPATWGTENDFGLYGMSGNVWNMTGYNYDPTTARYIYRLEDPDFLVGVIMGGSWARGAEYLQCGYQLSLSPGIRHPDVGFRPVREPKGSDWSIQHRKLSAISLGEGKIMLSWALLASDTKSSEFEVYRATNRLHSGFRITNAQVKESTTFIDEGLETGKRYHYYVRPVDHHGKTGRRSEWVNITSTEEASSAVMTFEPLFKQGSLVPVFGDLNGDGTMDCLVRMDNGNSEMSQDPGLPVQFEAFTSWGRSLWRRDICDHEFCYGSANNVPFNLWDMDGDGKAEVITRLQIGDSMYVAILDGLTGRVKHKATWPDMVSDMQKSSTRIHLSIAFLDGVHPAVVTQTGLYENEVFTAYDARLNQLWQYNSFAATNGSGGHKIEVVDVNGDGKQEVFNGTTCINHDGSLRWSIYKQHPDIVSIHDYLPERPGLEVFYVVESSMHAGVYMVDANTGEIIWKLNREDDPRWTHGHHGWTSDIWDGSTGIECISNRAGHSDQNMILFSADGRVLLEPFPFGLTPLEWDGDLTRELLGNNGHTIANFDGEKVFEVQGVQPNPFPDASLLMVADLYGDFRDELVLITTTEQGGKAIAVVTATGPMDKKFISATENLDYCLWLARNMGGGYRSIYNRILK